MMDQLTLVVINGILCGLLVISLGKLVYWKGQAKFHKNSANELYKRVLKQAEYIKRLRADRDAAALSAQEPFVPVSDSATVSAPLGFRNRKRPSRVSAEVPGRAELHPHLGWAKSQS